MLIKVFVDFSGTVNVPDDLNPADRMTKLPHTVTPREKYRRDWPRRLRCRLRRLLQWFVIFAVICLWAAIGAVGFLGIAHAPR